jgi:hypothetical protein
MVYTRYHNLFTFHNGSLQHIPKSSPNIIKSVYTWLSITKITQLTHSIYIYIGRLCHHHELHETSAFSSYSWWLYNLSNESQILYWVSQLCVFCDDYPSKPWFYYHNVSARADLRILWNKRTVSIRLPRTTVASSEIRHYCQMVLLSSLAEDMGRETLGVGWRAKSFKCIDAIPGNLKPLQD